MEWLMKIKMFSTFSLLVLLFAACTPSRAGAREPSNSNSHEQRATDPREELAKLGFYVFPEPVPVPSFTVPGIHGGSISTDDFAGTVTLLNFWATWCPPCRREMPAIERLHKQMEGYNFRIVAVSVSENKQTVQKFLESENYTFPIYLDERGAIGASLASQGIPTSYIIDATGAIIAGIVGAYDFDNEEIIRILREISQ